MVDPISTLLLLGEGVLPSILTSDIAIKWRSLQPVEVSSDLSPEEALQQVPGMLEKSVSQLEEIRQQLEESYKNAEKACENANDAYNKSKSIFKHKAAIEALQDATKSEAQAIIDLCITQKLLFTQQQILANCSKLLFICSARDYKSASSALKLLREIIQGTSGKNLTDIAKQEMSRIIESLKQRMDVLERLERLENRVSTLERN